MIKTGKTTDGALLCSLVQLARVVIVRVIVDGVLGVTVDVHIGHDVVLVIDVAIFVVIFCIWRCTLYSSRGYSRSFSHDENNRAKSTPKSALSSEPPTEKDGRKTLRRKNLRGRSPSGKFARQPSRDYLKGICTKSLCDYWHPSENLNQAISARFADRQVE